MMYGAATDIGKIRRVNEDNYIVHETGPFPYIMVADGMGGHNAGEKASLMAVETISEEIANKLTGDLNYVEAGEVIRRSFIEANSNIYNYSKNHYKVMGMGTTATLAMLHSDKIITAHVGDSRAYLIDDKEIRQITRDHSYVQELVMRGEITSEQAKHHPNKNYITRAMGAEEALKVDIGIRPYNGEKILVCSDGLTNMVEEDEILKVVNAGDDLQKVADTLISLANTAGGNDNITVVILERKKI